MLEQCIRLAEELRPRAVLIENVPGLRSMVGGYLFDRFITSLERIEVRPGRRYDVSYAMLNAGDYGLPQSRRRLFVVAVEPPLVWDWPEPTTALGDLTLWDAIADLPAGVSNGDDALPYRRLKTVSRYALELRCGSSVVLNHHTKRLEDLRLRRLAALRQGEDRRHLPAALQAGGHETKYRRLRANLPAPTLMAHMGKDLSDFIHPQLPRTITVREAARIQGFPDDYEFVGSQASQFAQVGNAVPVLLARTLGEQLVTVLAPQRARSGEKRTADPAVMEAVG
jgi:DNA (cytosine-5)-methyltransferase 1